MRLLGVRFFDFDEVERLIASGAQIELTAGRHEQSILFAEHLAPAVHRNHGLAPHHHPKLMALRGGLGEAVGGLQNRQAQTDSIALDGEARIEVATDAAALTQPTAETRESALNRMSR